jgi:outer membrane protease
VKENFTAKSKKSKKFLLIIITALIIPAIVQANDGVAQTQARPVSFSLDAETGMLWGAAGEYVYLGDALLSRLDWQENNVPFIGIRPAVKFGGFCFEAGLLSAIPAPSGSMEDRDWVGTTAMTNFSRHDAHLDYHFSLSAKAGYAFTLWRLNVEAGAGFAFSPRKWTARDGYLEYPPGSAKTSITGVVISYEQLVYMPFAALDIAFPLNIRLVNGLSVGGQFAVEISGLFYPFIWADTLDTHIIKKVEYADTMRGGLGGRVSIALHYTPASAQAIRYSAGLGFEGYSLSKGSTAQRSTGSGAYDFKTDAGSFSKTGSFTIDFFIGLRVLLGA